MYQPFRIPFALKNVVSRTVSHAYPYPSED
jgi:hypothetical protein